MKRERYDYSIDMDRDNCKHKRKKVFEIKPEWQENTISIIIECKDCTKIGIVDGTMDYYEEEVQWQND